MMASLGMTPTCAGVAQAYAAIAATLIIDEQDRHEAAAVEAHGVRAIVTDTIMRGPAEKRALAAAALAAVQ
jgi:LPPG:FO 2-phospho-L-lactate transferase